MEYDEKQLLGLLKNGSYEAYTYLYEKWVPLLFRFAYSLVKSKVTAEEIVQETFVKIWANHHTIDTDSSFKSYLFTITYHLVLREFRYRLNHPQMEDYLVLINDVAYSEQMTTQKHDFDSFLAKLQKAKSLLSPRQQKVFELNKEDNYSVKEIAEMLQLNEQSVRNLLSASLKIIRKELEYLSFFPLFIFLNLFFH